MFRNTRSARHGTTGLLMLAVSATLLGGAMLAHASDRAVLGELFSMDN